MEESNLPTFQADNYVKNEGVEKVCCVKSNYMFIEVSQCYV